MGDTIKGLITGLITGSLIAGTFAYNYSQRQSEQEIQRIINGTARENSRAYKLLQEKLETELHNNLSQNVVSVTNTKRIAQDTPKKPFDLDSLDMLNVFPDKDPQESVIILSADGIDGHDWKLPIMASEYIRYKKKNHRIRSIDDYVKFVTYRNRFIRQRAEDLTQFSSSKEKSAQLLLDFVHQHVYDKRIELSRDYVKYPIETLVERNGDCEDFSILGAALMKSIGLDVALVYIPPLPEKRSGHLAIGIHGDFNGYFFNVDKKKYYYAETTGTEWLSSPAKFKIGEIPKEYITRPVKLYIIQ